MKIKTKFVSIRKSNNKINQMEMEMNERESERCDER